ncbi:MAG: Gfo/Idh/MocA family oxidoreductase [Planctomycetes bacterium]|nr:Gfo/Idh/MocA family oxidoreductase [Planctomycetota bacterium]
MTRRTAIKLAGAFAAPLLLPARLLRGTANDALRIGCIGTGRMGHGDLGAVLRRGLEPAINARIVAVCDVDATRAAHARDEIRKVYAERLGDEPAPEITIYRDFRELLARDDIDGVTISTPDFWHAGHAIAAARARKDIYVQKPLTYSLVAGQKLVRAVRDHGVVLQTGSQQRSDARFRQACELVRNGRVGKLQRIDVSLPPDKGRGDPTEAPVPEQLDYDMWLGPTPVLPYAEHRVHPQQGYGRPGWLQIDRYCRGMITGWGSHMNDIAQWGHGSDRDSGIVSIRATAEFPDRGLFDVHTTFRAEARYADGVELVQQTGDPAGVRFTGSDGWIFVRRGGIEADPKTILDETIGDGELHLEVSDDHYRNFLECMRSRRDPICPVEIGHRSNSVCVVTHIAMKLGRQLHWDPAAERFVDDDAANAMLDFERREPWTL